MMRERGMLVALAGCALLLGACSVGAAEAGEEEGFRRWAVGWETRPALRYRTQGGWLFTVSGRIDKSDEEDLDGGEGNYYGDLEVSGTHSDADGIERNFDFEVSRLFYLGKGISAGPMLSIGHRYYHLEVDSERIYYNYDEDYYNYRTTNVDSRAETWTLEIGIQPVWQLHPRVSIEIELGIRYFNRKTRWRSLEDYENSDGDTSSSESLDESEDSVWEYFPYSVNTDMALGLYVYF